MGLEELFPEAPNPLAEWRNAANLWQTLPNSEWLSFLNKVRVKHLNGNGSHKYRPIIVRDRGEAVNVGECIGFEFIHSDIRELDVLDPYREKIFHFSSTSEELRRIAMTIDSTSANMILRFSPYFHRTSWTINGWGVDPDRRRLWFREHEALRLWLETPETEPKARLTGYRRLLSGRSLDPQQFSALRQAAEDMRWPAQPDSRYKEQLRRLVLGYLDGLHEVLPGLGSPRKVIQVVLELFPEDFLPNDESNRLLELSDTWNYNSEY